MEYAMNKETALVEAVLYMETDPADTQKLGRLTGLGSDIVEKALEILQERYANESYGMELLRSGDGYMLSLKKEYWETLKEYYGKKNEAKLSRAAMETLAIIAYSQPVTRGEIEAIRGVQCDNMVRLLIERNLIRETGKKEIPGRPVQFGTTKEFLKFFRLESIAELPKLDESEADRFELQIEA
jgi:segregation and condensation protein B